jgi:hypothetical protein
MKSYFLAPIESRIKAVAALNSALPCQNKTWLLKDDDGDAIAYFYFVDVDDMTGMPGIAVDVSGRHYTRDADVVAVLEALKNRLGGEIIYAP